MNKSKTTISFISTVLNEEDSIYGLLESLEKQTVKPDEIIIVDGGSGDKTRSLILDYQKKSKLKIKLIDKKGNRSVGRNAAISRTKGEIILCSDAGCVLDKNWTKNILATFKDEGIEVAAGYYKGEAKATFQKCLIPYALVMPDQLDPDNFLPATRSMAFRKTAWKKAGKFDESLSHNEDYAFANKLKENGAKIVFAKNAVVTWLPPDSFKSAFKMFYRFAYGDAEAGLYRPKVLLIFLRYVIAFTILFGILIPLGILYCFWAISKNYKYVNDQKAYYLLPAIQFTSDLAVMSGTILGLTKRLL